MEFLGVGYQEFILVLVLLLVVVGPERLPTVAYQLGRAVRTLQQYARAVRTEFRDEFDYLEEQVKTVRGEVDEGRRALRDQQRIFQEELRSVTPELPPLIEEPQPSASSPSDVPVPAANEAPPAAAAAPGGDKLVF